MNFGDILDAWEQEQKSAGQKSVKSTGQEWRSKKTEPVGKKEKESDPELVKKPRGISQDKERVNPMTEWLRRYGVVDKDAAAEEAAEKEHLQDRSWLLDMPYEAQIDLHGLTAEESVVRLNHFISECYNRGIRKVLIIHGKGNHSEDAPVLAGVVRSFIERDYRLGESGHPDKKDGGKGATWVIIREKNVFD
ncbi:MAG: Smr/MutS family protein [Treponemataceae bacterium]|nr:Smr/MutS family protein [Treponemataceae bacterium]